MGALPRHLGRFPALRGTTPKHRLRRHSNLGANPVWSGDGTSVCYTSSSEGGQRIVFQRFGAAADPRLLRTSNAQFQAPTGFTPDGRTLVYSAIAPTTQFDLWAVPMDGSAAPTLLVRTSAWETDGVVSPDGLWLAFSSDETGKAEVYVESFPVPSRRVRISTGGGSSPQWTRDGKELMYQRQDHGGASIMSAAVETGAGFHPGMPRVLFRVAGLLAFSTTRDGERILVSAETGVSPPPSIALILDWPEQMRDR
jgi:Tol biopolymer transport system component